MMNYSVAIAVPDGLVTPVIRNAQAKTMLELSKAVEVLAEKAKNKKLSRTISPAARSRSPTWVPTGSTT